MQQNNLSESPQSTLHSKSSKLPACVRNVMTFMEEAQKFLEKELTPVVRVQLGHLQYPIKMFKDKVGFPPKDAGNWYQLRNMYKRRVEKFQQNSSPNGFMYVSDIVCWAIPNLMFCYMGIMNYIRTWKSQGRANDKIQLCKKIVSQRGDNNLPQILEVGVQKIEENILRRPLDFIEELFLKFSEVKSYYTFKQQEWTKALEGSQQRNEQIATLLCQLKHELLQLQTRIQEAEKLCKDIQNGERLDPEVYKVRIISGQFKGVEPNNKHLVKFGIRAKFLVILKKRVVKAQKRIKERKDSVFQLIDKEKFYIDIIAEYIQYIKDPIQKLEILTGEENTALFCNISEIKSFHEIFYNKLSARFEKDHKYQTYGDIIKEIIPFFKLYVDYIYIAESAQNFMIKLEKENQKVAEICEKYFIQKHKTASNELMQPTFKIARYEMLFDEIIKKTNPIHPDCALLNQAKELFRKNLTEINDVVDKIVRRNKLNQLEQEFGTAEQPIFKENREFLSEFSLFMIRDEKLIPILLFCFSDLILIAEEPTRKKIKYIKVDQKFYVRREEDNKTYRNMIKIHSDGFITLSAGIEDKNFKKAEEAFEELKKIEKVTEGSQLVYVVVLGTEEIGSTSFAKHTEYIIEIKFLSLRKMLHLRFSDMANIVKVMQNYYKTQLGITEEETLKKTWFNNHKSKTIEDRKRTLQQILQKLFNHQAVRNEPKFLLKFLGLPTNYFEVAKKVSLQRNSTTPLMTSILKAFDSHGKLPPHPNSMVKKDSLSRRELKEAFTILCATEVRLGRDIYHDMDEDLQIAKEKAEKIEIYISTCKEDETVMIRVTEYDTVEDVCNKVSKLIGLRSNRDFRLFHEIGKKQLRVLEHEQLILKLFTFPSNKQTVQGVLDSMTSSIKKLVNPQTHPTLIFKKYYFLPFDIEHREAKKDLTRLRLLTYQVFSEVKEMKYQLNFDEYLLFTALIIYIELDGDIETKNIDSEIVHKIVPETIFKLKNYTESQWIDKVQPHLVKLQSEIKKVIDYNKEQMKYNKIKTDTISKTALYFGHRHLASQIVLNKIKNNPIYGSNLFYVQPYKATYEELKADRKMAYNMWLALKVDSLSLLTPSSKESQFELKYTDIEKVNVYSEAIVLKTDDYTNKSYRFNTYQSFEMSQLIKYYQTLNQILKDLENNEQLASQVKQYKDEILLYRSTYEGLEGASKINIF